MASVKKRKKNHNLGNYLAFVRCVTLSYARRSKRRQLGRHLQVVERRSLGSIAPVGKIGIKASLAGAHASEFVVKIEKLGVNLELGASLVRLARCLPGAAHPAPFFLGTFP